jgi:MFS family permease
MDHIGAIVGPLLATAFLVSYPSRYRMLFALTAIPGAFTLLLLSFAREPKQTAVSAAEQRVDIPITALPSPLFRYFIVLSIFTLGNSTDAFLLLRLTEAAGGPRFIPLMWAALHVVKTVFSVAGGTASDRFGRRKLIAIGWVVYAVVYSGFAVSSSLWALVAWFMIYGVYYGCVEGTERALIADFALPSQKGTAFGVYNAVSGLGALVSSIVFGVLWTKFGAGVAFGSGAALAIVAALLLFVLVPPPKPRT